MSDPVSEAAARFGRLAALPEEAIPLDEAALLIESRERPGLDTSAELARLDRLADGCVEATLDGLRRHLFDEVGLRGNDAGYSDPRNSFLTDVLDRGVGIPISLAVITMEVGRRIGVRLEGVGMPGHFLVRHVGDPPVLMDAFGGGRILDDRDAEELYRRVYGDAAPFVPEMLAAVGPRAILGRMLNNLRQLYQQIGDAASAGWVMGLRAAIPAAGIGEMIDLARVQASLGRFGEAATTLDTMAELLPADRARKAGAEAQLLRSRLN